MSFEDCPSVIVVVLRRHCLRLLARLGVIDQNKHASWLAEKNPLSRVRGNLPLLNVGTNTCQVRIDAYVTINTTHDQRRTKKNNKTSVKQRETYVRILIGAKLFTSGQKDDSGGIRTRAGEDYGLNVAP